MKKTLLSLLLLVATATTNGQSLLLGDTDQNGELTLADVTMSANMIVGKEPQGAIDLTGMAYQVDNTAMRGKHYVLDGQTVRFNTDDTTNYPGGATYEFRPLQGTLLVLDADSQPVKTLHVVRADESEVLLQDYMTGTYLNCIGYEYVDLGLPSGTLWATCNIGADSPEEYGPYFAWGETSGYASGTGDGHKFSWDTYMWSVYSYSSLTKYCYDSNFGYNGFTDTLTELEVSDDAAYVNWGGEWRMPSLSQIYELINTQYTTTTWTTQNGVNGHRITSKTNGNSIFLPAAGWRDGTGIDEVGSQGRYWSRTLHTGADGPYFAHILRCYSYVNTLETDHTGRYVGQSIRPVRASQ